MINFTKYILVFLLSAVFFVGCEEINNLLTQDVDFSKTFNANVTNENFPQTKTDCINLTSDQTFNDNKSKLDGVTFVSILVTITNWDPANIPSHNQATFDQMSFALKFNGETSELPLESASNVSVSELLSGKTFLLGTKYDYIANKIKDNPDFCLIAKYGNLVGYPTNNIKNASIKFDLKMKLKVKL